MANTASSKARPIIPPAIPPATAAVFDFRAGSAVVTAGPLLGTGVEVVDVGAMNAPEPAPAGVSAILVELVGAGDGSDDDVIYGDKKIKDTEVSAD